MTAQPLASQRESSRVAPKVLVIDDEPDLRTLYELSLAREGYDVVTADSVAQALGALSTQEFHAVISDMKLPDGLGLEVLKFLSQHQRRERCVVITAYGSAENAVEALKAGAFDYLSKPVDLKQFRLVVSQAINLGTIELAGAEPAGKLGAELHSQQASAQGAAPDVAQQALRAIVGSSALMMHLRARIAKVARSMAPVLVQGESGTGKELVARAIHACSHRSQGPFIAVNCSAVPEHLLEAEFFGSRKGSYTGSTADREGLFQAAHGGTLFLDEIGDLPISMQAKLLRAIQERSIRAVGDNVEQAVNVRIVSATHRNLAAAVAANQFRQDLFYRINVIDLHLPPLRERREDLAELVASLLERIAKEAGVSVPPATPAFIEGLRTLPLPGNVRELENLLHRAVALSDGQPLSDLELAERPLAQDVMPVLAAQSGPADTGAGATPSLGSIDSSTVDLQAHLDQQERQLIVKALSETGFNRTAAAARLGISLRQIRYRMVRLGIEADDAKP